MCKRALLFLQENVFGIDLFQLSICSRGNKKYKLALAVGLSSFQNEGNRFIAAL